MTEYEFTLKFRLPDADADPARFLEALGAAGCDDAMVGVGQRGRIALDFTREARSAMDAVASAVRAVRKAIPGAELVEASPDFVGLTDVAGILGCSRQNMRKLMLGNAASFPDAVHEGAQAVWHLRPVLGWFAQSQRYAIDPALMEVAEVTMQLNIARQARRLRGARIPGEIAALFA